MREIRIHTTEEAMHDLWQLQKDTQTHNAMIHDSIIDELKTARKLIARMSKIYDRITGE